MAASAIAAFLLISCATVAAARTTDEHLDGVFQPDGSRLTAGLQMQRPLADQDARAFNRGGRRGPKAASMSDYVSNVWGSLPWPPVGAEKRPLQDGAPVPWSTRLVLLGILGAFVLGAILCNTSWLQVQPPKEHRFLMHLHALASSIMWRHMHYRAGLLHFARVAVPVLLLFLLYKMQGLIERAVNSDGASGIIDLIGGGSQAGVVEAIVETALAIGFVYVVMMSMVFFVWHIGAESESGFRHLLHVSGLSRPAYILATAGIDGILLALIGVLVMVVVAGGILSVRMVLWSSPVLLFVAISLLSASAIMTGYLVHFICPSARLASIVSQIVLIMVIFAAPFSSLDSAVPASGQQTWRMMFLPTIPAYRATFQLVAGCIRGRCLGLDDLAAGFAGNWAGPIRVLLGANEAPEMTPPEAMISLFSFVLFQLVIGWTVVVLFDRYYHPSLHESGAHGSQLQTEQGVVLQVSNLVHWYGWLHEAKKEPKDKVLNGVSFSLSRGSMLGMLGPNGAGKTTVIRCITGEERPTEGKVAIGGGDSALIGLCPQETVVNGDLTVAENLLFFARLRGAYGKEGAECVEKCLQATSLGDKRDDLPSTLSGGMRRRLAVGCAMVCTPAVAILDEPTTGLDPMNRRSLWETINSIKAAGGCCLLTTHMLEEAEFLCSHIMILMKGSVAAEGSVQQLKDMWGIGYMLSVDCHSGKEEEAKGFIKSLLAEQDQAPVASKNDGQMTFRFTQDEEALGNAIIRMARGKDGHGIRHWGISQASLEDAYVRIIQQNSKHPHAE